MPGENWEEREVLEGGALAPLSFIPPSLIKGRGWGGQVDKQFHYTVLEVAFQIE